MDKNELQQKFDQLYIQQIKKAVHENKETLFTLQKEDMFFMIDVQAQRELGEEIVRLLTIRTNEKQIMNKYEASRALEIFHELIKNTINLENWLNENEKELMRGK